MGCEATGAGHEREEGASVGEGLTVVASRRRNGPPRRTGDVGPSRPRRLRARVTQESSGPPPPSLVLRRSDPGPPVPSGPFPPDPAGRLPRPGPADGRGNGKLGPSAGVGRLCELPDPTSQGRSRGRGTAGGGDGRPGWGWGWGRRARLPALSAPPAQTLTASCERCGSQ